VNLAILKNEFFYSIATLLVSFILVQSVYALVIRPKAEVLMQHRLMEMQQGLRQTSLRSFYVIVKDYEQEAACVLALWALSLVAYRAVRVLNDRKLLDVDFLEMNDDLVILPDDVASVSRRVSQVAPTRTKSCCPGPSP